MVAGAGLTGLATRHKLPLPSVSRCDGQPDSLGKVHRKFRDSFIIGIEIISEHFVVSIDTELTTI